MNDLQEVKAELTQIKAMLRKLLGQQHVAGGVDSVCPGGVDVATEIAMVRASGGDIREHLKAKAKRQMAEEKQRKNGV